MDKFMVYECLWWFMTVGGYHMKKFILFYRMDWSLLWFIDVYDMGWHRGKKHMKKFNIVWGLLMFMTSEKKTHEEVFNSTYD